MTNYKIFVGTKDGITDVYKYDNDDYKNIIIHILDDYGFNGFTMYNAVGVWNGEKENTFVIEMLDDKNIINYDDIVNCVNCVKAVLNQNCILVEKQDIQAEFI